MAEAKVDAPPLRLEDLAGYLAAGCRSPAAFKVGAEHEKFGFRQATLRPIPYEGDDGIEALLEGMMRLGWQGDYEARDGGETLIALTRQGASISLEPGGQFELSGAPLATMHDICTETSQHLKETKLVADELGLLQVLGSASWAWASRPCGGWTKCRSCPRPATRSCASTCPRWGPAGWT